MHASHSESSKKIYHRLYKLSADKISAKQFIRYSSGKPLYRISRNQFIGRNKTGATTHGAGFTNIEAGFMKQVLYLPVVCGEINLSSRLDIQFYRLQHVFPDLGLYPTLPYLKYHVPKPVHKHFYLFPTLLLQSL